MKITWHGHSCFSIQGKDATVVIDPFSEEIGLKLPKLKADILAISHDHPGHNNKQAVEGEYFLCDWPGEYEKSGVQILGIPAFHYSKSQEESTKDQGKIIIFHITVDDIRICHLSDLGHTLTNELTEHIGDVDILLLPVGGIKTINSKKALEVVEQIDPKLVIPMHYKIDGLIYELDPINTFLKEIGKELNPEPFFQIKKPADLSNESTDFVVLEAK